MFNELTEIDNIYCNLCGIKIVTYPH